jgi:hypothetical protein
MNTAHKNLSLFSLVLLAGAASSASAQSLVSSGLLHSSVGAGQLTEISARRVPVRNLGSSGNDGVDIQLHSLQGGQVEIDMGPLFDPANAGKEIKIKHKGWDGLIYGTHRRTAGGGGGSGGSVAIQDEVDFSAMGSVQLRAIATFSDGTTADISAGFGSSLSFTSLYAEDPTSPPVATMGAGKASFSDLSFMATLHNSRPATIVVPRGEGQFYIYPDVITMSFRPICIVAPCPGDWTNLQSMEITSTLPEFECSNAALDWSWGTSNPTTIGSSGLGAGRVLLHGTPGSVIEELHNTDLDGDGVPDVAIRCGGVDTLPDTRGIVTTFNSPPTDHFSFRHNKTGHITLMKFTDDEGDEMRISTVTDPISDATQLIPDMSSLGSDQVLVTALDGNNNPLGSYIIISGTGLVAVGNPHCLPGFVPIYERVGNVLIWVGCRIGYFDLVIPGGGTLPGVQSLRFEPINPVASLDSLASLSVESCCEDIIIGDLRFIGPVGPVCDSIDFNNDTGFFDPMDIDAFLSVFSEGPCIPDTAACNDIDFNNDGSLFDPCDINAFLLTFAEGPCTLCGE